MISATSAAGRDLKTAKYRTRDTVDLEKSILFQKNLVVNCKSIDSIGSLAI